MKIISLIAAAMIALSMPALAETATPGQRHDLREASRETKHDIREASRSNRIDNNQGAVAKTALVEGDHSSRQNKRKNNQNDRQYKRLVR